MPPIPEWELRTRRGFSQGKPEPLEKTQTDGLPKLSPTRKMNVHLRREFALVVYATSLAGHRPSPLFTQQDVGERGTEAQTPAQIGVIVSDSNNRAACYLSS